MSHHSHPTTSLALEAYERDLRNLQIELIKLLDHVRQHGERIAILFEGRDTAGKGGTIFHFTRFLNPKAIRVVALPAPSDVERGQWYFQRYLRQLPNRGEIVFFDRSWYNRAVVEPVMGFCTPEEYHRFLHQVVDVERLLREDGLHLIKFWFSIFPEVQRQRLQERQTDPLKRWKLSTVDVHAQQKWQEFTRHKEVMFETTHRLECPWIIVQGNDKERARLASMRHVLSRFDYEGKDPSVDLTPDPEILSVYEGPTRSV